jgi:transcriptional regulator with XRE-family HTH domain
LVASGDYEAMSHGDYLELLGLSVTLRQEREKAGLSLNDLAERSGMDKAFLSKLENGQLPNPTVSTLVRYAAALGKRLVVSMTSAAKSG